MEAVFLQILNMSITASWLILAVIILRVCLKKAPKFIRCILWALVGLRLVLPFSFESVLSLIPSANTISAENLYTETPSIDSGISAVDSVVNPVISHSSETQFVSGVSVIEAVTSIASILWIAGIVGMLIYSVVSYIKLSRKVSASINISDNVYCCDDISAPFILGIIKPKIYLPSGMADQQAEYVIAHENAHIKRRDHWWKPLGFVILAVYWFNPLIWIAYVLLCRDIEMACDEKVIKNMDNEFKAEYSNALVECSTQQRRMIMACPLSFGEVGVKDRIKSVLNYKKPALWIIIVAIIACIGVTIAFMTNPSVEENNNNYLEINGYTTHKDVDIHLVELNLDTDDPYMIIEWENNSGKTFIDETGPYKIFRKYADEKVSVEKQDGVWHTAQTMYVSMIKQKREIFLSRWDLTQRGTYLLEYEFKFKDSDEVHKARLKFKVNKNKLGKYYSLKYNDKKSTYSYEIRDKHNNILLADISKSHTVSIDAVTDNVLKLFIDGGTGTGTGTTIYCNIENGRVSNMFNCVMAEYENKVIYWDKSDGKNLNLIVEDFFDKDVFYKKLDLGYSPTVEPISSIIINNNIAYLTYWKGDWELERPWTSSWEEKIKFRIDNTTSNYKKIPSDKLLGVAYFSFEEDYEKYIKIETGVKTDGFINTAKNKIESTEDALKIAKNEVTVSYDMIDIYIDFEKNYWKFHFYTENMLGGDQILYLNSDGQTVLSVLGE